MPGINPWEYAEKSGTEHAHQAALFMWANMAARFGLIAADQKASYTEKGWAQSQFERGSEPVPQLKWLHAIHNQGHGDAIRGGKAKAEGVKAGVADIFLPVPRHSRALEKYEFCGVICGLYLELKVGKNMPSPIQLEFMADMRAAGYVADWAVGWLEARQKICDYLQISC